MRTKGEGAIRPRRLLIIPGLVLLLGFEVWALASRQYSKAWLKRRDLHAVLKPPSPLELDDLSWDPRLYQGEPSLEPLAALVREHCPGKRALETATCLSAVLAKRFPHGAPNTEVFDRNFDPVEVARSHLAGAPGHCVSRSAIVTTALLASGFPSRMVQLLPPPDTTVRGHNVLEVWDGREWIFFDPTYGGTLATDKGDRSAAALLAAGGELKWRQLAPTPATLEPELLDGEILYAGSPTPRLAGHIVYPEPWIYTRVHHKLAPRIFNGTFVVVGEPVFRLTVGQNVIHVAIVLTSAALAVAFVQVGLALVGRFRSARSTVMAARAAAATGNEGPRRA